MADLRWDSVTVDCRDPESLAEFWAALLGVEVRGRWQQFVGLHPTAPGLPRLVFQRVDDARPAKNSLHLDLHVAGPSDLPDAIARAVALGARAVTAQEVDGESWQVMADPEGNVFCLVAD
ncbi:MAG: VOC family protein [Mycobacteriales bacterium]